MRATLMLAIFGLAVVLSGCTSRTALTIENSATRSVMILQTYDTVNYLVMGSSAYRYWRCVEQGDELVCYPDCGAKGTDLECPGFNFN